jgi:hypothetical protein
LQYIAIFENLSCFIFVDNFFLIITFLKIKLKTKCLVEDNNHKDLEVEALVAALPEVSAIHKINNKLKALVGEEHLDSKMLKEEPAVVFSEVAVLVKHPHLEVAVVSEAVDSDLQLLNQVVSLVHPKVFQDSEHLKQLKVDSEE